MTVGAESLDFEIRPNPQPVPPDERAAWVANPGFGRVFTDHMVTIRYTEGKGWYDARVEARGPIPMDPASGVLHYGQEVFEGLKAYRTVDGGVTMFRPADNARRFARSAVRIAMPALPERVFLDSLCELVRIDAAWIPDNDDEASLYLRPFMFASEFFLGVRPSTEYLYVAIASPVGSYFSGGVRPVSVWVTHEYTRSAPGGSGAAKYGGNYGAALLPQTQAMENGCDQVLFLDAVERRFVQELGGMNVFCGYADGTLVTPPLGDAILAGITRDSIITLADQMGHRVQERPVALDDLRADARSGALREVFACGTAAVLTPIGSVRSQDGEFVVGDGGTGPMTALLRQSLVDIQRGRVEDRNGWLYRVL